MDVDDLGPSSRDLDDSSDDMSVDQASNESGSDSILSYGEQDSDSEADGVSINSEEFYMTQRAPEHDNTINLQRRMNVWESARQKLSYLQRPTEPLLCREQEHAKLKEILESMLTPYDAAGHVLGGVVFIAGVPGTGKTATYRIVASQLKTEMKEQNKVNSSSTLGLQQASHRGFISVEVNAMKLSQPRMVYPHLWLTLNRKIHQKEGNQWASTLSGKDARKYILGIEAAQQKLDEYFRGDNKDQGRHETRTPILLLLDEIELLMTKDQQILYTLFEWARLPTAKLVLVGIANMLDLPERVHQKINSRLGTNRIIFNPYQASQLKLILMQKMEGDMKLFEDESVLDYIAKKVGSSKGDARLTFEVCSRSLRFAETHTIRKQDGKSRDELESMETEDEGFIVRVSTSIVDQVFLAMRDNARTIALEGTTLHERVWILSVLYEIGARRVWRDQVSEYQRQFISKMAQLKLDDDVTFYDVTYSRYSSFCTDLKLQPRSTSAIQVSSSRIFQIGIFAPNIHDRSLQRAIYLKLDPEEIIQVIYKVSDSRIRSIVEMHQLPNMFGFELAQNSSKATS
jgi:Cdc6-like AAA superfamily ATPase